MLFAPCTEGLTAVESCDRSGYWVMLHEYGNPNFRCYKIGTTGLEDEALISNIVQTFNDFVTYMRFSPNGDYLCAYNYSNIGADLFRFDSSTGELYDNVILPHGGYGICFTPSGKRLFFTSSGNIIYQYDMEAFDVISSEIIYYDELADNSTYGAIQNSLDGNLTVSSYFQDSISTIINPDEPLSSSNVLRNNIWLEGKQTLSGGITEFVQSFFSSSTIFDCNEGGIVSNIFSPNGDGLNDYFFFPRLSDADLLIIFDRWGNEVVTSENNSDFWNGNNRIGERCSEGVYYYVIVSRRNPNSGYIHLTSN